MRRLVALERGQTALMQQLAQMGAELQVTRPAQCWMSQACRILLSVWGVHVINAEAT